MTLPADAVGGKHRFRAGYYLFLLFLANLLNFADRALLGIVVDPIRADLRLNDTEMSLVAGIAFVLFNLLVGLFLARSIDRGNRKRILILGVSLWSGATALTGVAQGFYSLAATRILVGIGEATVFPVAVSIIADVIAAPRRPQALSVFQSGTFVGLVGGSILAGVLAAEHGWRAMFLICGASGFTLVLLLILTMDEPARDQRQSTPRPAPAPALDSSVRQSLAQLLKIRGFPALSWGIAFSTMATSVLPVWAPAFLLRSHAVPLANVGALIGPAVGLGSIAGTLVSGGIAGRLIRTRGSDAHGLWVPMIAVPLATPFYVIFLFAPSLTVTMAAAAAMNFLLAMAIAPCFAMAIEMSPHGMRALSSTCLLILSGIVGGAVAPACVGGLSDLLQSRAGVDSLRYGLASMAPTPAIAGVFLWLAYSRLNRLDGRANHRALGS